MLSRQIREKSVRRVKELLDASERIVVVSHMAPDGDAIGSSLAVMHVLSALGKAVKVVVPDQFLADLKILPGAELIIDATKSPDKAKKAFDAADLVLCLDFNMPSRVGKLESVLKNSSAPKVLVDHHPNPDIDAEVVISLPDMSSTCYLLFRLLCRLELYNYIDAKVANCILAGMMTDTGNFSYSSSDPEMYVVVAELLKKGADKEALYQALFNTFSEDCLRLNAYALSEKMEVFEECGASLITLSRAELNKYNYVKGDTEGLVNKPLAIPSVRFSVFMREETNNIRVSMRSVDDFPVNALCSEYFGGGGHLNAAGGEYYGTLDDATEYFRSLLPEILKKYPNITNK